MMDKETMHVSVRNLLQDKIKKKKFKVEFTYVTWTTLMGHNILNSKQTYVCKKSIDII